MNGNRMTGKIMSIIISIAFALSALMALMLLFEDKFIYFPYKYPEGNWNPQSYGLHAEDCYFVTADGLRLHGWFFPVNDAKATLLWAHGNAGNITHRLDNIRRLLPLGINVFIFDYRGYGKSEGKPSEEGLYEDALSAYDYLAQERKIDPTTIIVFGRSLGAIVAVDLAVKRPCRGLILETPFTSAKDMVKELFPILPLQFLIRSKFDAGSQIANIHVPILFTHGSADRTVPIRLARRLYDAANPPKWFYEIAGADHNNTYLVGGEEYFRRINDFIELTLAP